MRAALLQLRSGDDPAVNLAVTEALLREAASGGATFVATPECTNMVSFSRELQAERLTWSTLTTEPSALPQGAAPTQATPSFFELMTRDGKYTPAYAAALTTWPSSRLIMPLMA